MVVMEHTVYSEKRNKTNLSHGGGFDGSGNDGDESGGNR